MQSLTIFSDSPAGTPGLRETLQRSFDVQVLELNALTDKKPDRFTIFDIALNDQKRLSSLKDWLSDKPKNSKTIFIVPGNSHLDIVRANALGATSVVHHPLNQIELLSALLGDASLLCTKNVLPEGTPESVQAASSSLHDAFISAHQDERIETSAVETAGESVVSEISSKGISNWISAVRQHHSQTYQHCLLVTGTAAAFGCCLGFSEADRIRLAVAGMLHDIGKAKIPISILEKPRALDENEMKIMKQHPQLGAELLADTPGIPRDIVDVVLHHHEYLDGTGYPHGLRGGEIDDLVRIMTISDIFGALIEKRAYKPPMSREAAYQMLLDMGNKLDGTLVREFKAVAQLS